MHRLAPLLLLLALACARAPANAGPTRARARAPFDAHAQPGTLVELEAGCESCQGDPTFKWSVAVAPASGPDCQLSPPEASRLDLTCPAQGLWVLRLDVEDDRGPGQPDYVNVTYSLAANTASTSSSGTGASAGTSGVVSSSASSSGSVGTTGGTGTHASASSSSTASSSGAGTTGRTTSSSSAASTSSSSSSATSSSSGTTGSGSAGSSGTGGTTGGLITGSLRLTEPDGSTPATDVVPGDLVEAHASALAVFGTLSCSFAVTGGSAQLPPPGSTSCDAPIYPLEAGSYTVTVTFSSLGLTGTASAALTVHDFTTTSVQSTSITAVAADPLSGQVAVAKANGHVMYDPVNRTSVTTAFHSNHDGLCADALGGESVVGGQSNSLGGYDTRSGGSSYEDYNTLNGDVITVAMVGQAPAQPGGAWTNISLGSDGTDLMVWTDADQPVTDPRGWRLMGAAVNASQLGLPANLHASIGVYGVKDDQTMEFAYFSDLDALAKGTTTPLTVHPLAAPLSSGRITALASGPQQNGTVWLGTSADGLYGFTHVVSTRSSSLGTATTTLDTQGQPVDSLALVIDGPWSGDVWAVVGGALARVSACDNTVGAPPVLLSLVAQPPGAPVVSVSAGSAQPGPAGVPVLWVGSSSGLKRLGPDQ